jgi:quinol monooxygenase YgiN
MTVAVVSDYQDADLSQYDQIMAHLGYVPAGPGPVGLLFHWATKTPDGVRTVEVWSDRETHDAHAQARVTPAAAESGIGEAPRVAYIDVHNHLTQP